MESIHRRVVNCNSYAKVPSFIQRTAVQLFHLIWNGRFSSFPPILTVDWSTATVMQRTSPLFSIPLFSNPKSVGVDLDFSIPRSTSHIDAKFQEMIPCRLQEVLFHHGSWSCQILSHDSVLMIVSRFTSLIQDFVLCCYQFSQILLLEVWLHLCDSCIESK